MNNENLKFDLEKIKSFDLPIKVEKSFILDNNFDYPFIIDVNDNSYFYAEEKERDDDYNNLLKYLN